MIERYARPEMIAIWSEEGKYRRWLDVELAVCEVHAERGLIPKEALETIRARAAVDPARVNEIESKVRHDVIAFLTNVAENVGPASRYVHYGMTSSDVLDTALALQIRDSGQLVQAGLARICAALRDRAMEFKNTPCIGRTNGDHAEPTTFGRRVRDTAAKRSSRSRRRSCTRSSGSSSPEPLDSSVAQPSARARAVV